MGLGALEARWAAENLTTMQRRRLTTTVEVTAALHALEIQPHRVRADAWPGDLRDLDSPGMYSWWVDAQGASDLTIGLGHSVRPGRIYAGQTGATRWPSGVTPKTTLRVRIGNNHLRGRIRSSTFRLTFAAALRSALELRPTGPKRLAIDDEGMLSDWIRAHLELAVHPFKHRDPLKDLEDRVLLELDPPLNLEGMNVTPLRATLSGLREELAHHAPAEDQKPPAPVLVVAAGQTQPAKRDSTHVSALIQQELQRRGLTAVSAVEAARWLHAAGVLVDSDHRPGLPLRKLLREGLIVGAEQRPPRSNGRWFIIHVARDQR
jgi:hypothetical protein